MDNSNISRFLPTQLFNHGQWWSKVWEKKEK